MFLNPVTFFRSFSSESCYTIVEKLVEFIMKIRHGRYYAKYLLETFIFRIFNLFDDKNQR